jgi:hypothetical protein
MSKRDDKRDDTLAEQCMVNPSEFDYKKYAKLIRADESEECAKVAEQYGPDRPIITKQPSERVKGNWEGEQAASSGISAAIRARSKA